MDSVDDDFIDILDDTEDTLGVAAQLPWRLLVVDDDEEVHAATRFALQGIRILGRELMLVHTHSSAQTRELLKEDKDFAVILLDVVMETEDAGLHMIGFIRRDMGMDETRIILRTGQPGYAPELSVFNDYDINDYRTKSELTRTRLITAITAALRSYQQLRAIVENRRGLEMIVAAAAQLTERRQAMNTFAEGVLVQVASLLKIPPDGIVCALRGEPWGGERTGDLYIFGAAGRYAPNIAKPLGELRNERIVAAIAHCIQQGRHEFSGSYTTIYLRSGDSEGAIYLETSEPITEIDKQLIEVFATSISACFGNIKLVEQLEFVAYHDPLTGLGNRSQFILDLDHLGAARHTDHVVALLDIEHFADINDGLGHEVGNLLLQSIACRLVHALPDCRVSRIGADVFGIHGPGAQMQPDRLLALMEEPFLAGEHALPIGGTLGLVRLLEGGVGGLTLLKRANIALNRAKKSLHARYEYFIEDMEDKTKWRLEIIRHLRQDFSDRKLSVWYQPQVALSTGQVVGIEALLRWPSPDTPGGFIHPPGVFVPLAEYSGLIIEIGRWVLAQACQDMASLSGLAHAPSKVAVNVSMPQFRHQQLQHAVHDALAASGLPAGQLELEITESLAMDEPKIVIAALQQLKSRGVRIAIDDFGAGYSSLGHLRELPIDSLKIDQNFVREISCGKGGMFAETIVALAQKLNLDTVAEGVETAEQAGFMRALGCRTAQGYLYARPMPLQVLKEWLAQYKG